MILENCALFLCLLIASPGDEPVPQTASDKAAARNAFMEAWFVETHDKKAEESLILYNKIRELYPSSSFAPEALARTIGLEVRLGKKEAAALHLEELEAKHPDCTDLIRKARWNLEREQRRSKRPSRRFPPKKPESEQSGIGTEPDASEFPLVEGKGQHPGRTGEPSGGNQPRMRRPSGIDFSLIDRLLDEARKREKEGDIRGAELLRDRAVDLILEQKSGRGQRAGSIPPKRERLQREAKRIEKRIKELEAEGKHAEAEELRAEVEIIRRNLKSLKRNKKTDKDLKRLFPPEDNEKKDDIEILRRKIEALKRELDEKPAEEKTPPPEEAGPVTTDDSG